MLTKSLKSEIVELKNKQPEYFIDSKAVLKSKTNSWTSHFVVSFYTELQAAISLVDGIRNNETDAAGAVAAASSRRSSKPNNMVSLDYFYILKNFIVS